ncbi:MAG: hypothetical protein ACTSYD_04400, partial [Candidatus Heimdallarchaeaceae archaeon]
LIANDLLCELNSSDYETDWIYAAKTSIAAIKAGTELNNATLTSEGYTKLNQLFEKAYYVNDNDTAGFKLKIAEYLLNYNTSYAEEIVNYVIGLLFHTPYGLEPIVATEKAMHDVFKGITFIAVFKLRYLEVLPKLAMEVNNNSYIDIFKEILRYYLSNLYYDRNSSTYLDSFETNYTIDDFDHIHYTFVTITYSLKYNLLHLLNLLNSSEIIMDTEAPKSEKSYWIGTKDRFSIIKEEYTKINDTVTITPVEGKELFLKIELSDSYGIGLKTSVLYKDTTKILVVRPIYQESQWLYIEFIHSPLVIKNETDTFNYFIVYLLILIVKNSME